jgi:hypothetical protein
MKKSHSFKITRYFNVMVWGFCYLRIFKKMHSISGRSLRIHVTTNSTETNECLKDLLQRIFYNIFSISPLYTYHFINKKIKILNVGNFAVVGDIFYVA